MTLSGISVCRLARFLAYHVTGEPPARIGESQARITLYPTRHRQVMGAPQTAPGERSTRPRGQAHQELADEHHE